MKFPELLEHEWEEGYYYCSECGDISYIPEDEDFEVTEFITATCDTCKKKTNQYAIIEPTFNWVVRILETQSSEEEKP